MDRLPEPPMAMPRSEKIDERHLERLAVVYVRQSTVQQIMDHRESTNLQYGLVDRAIAMGWPRGASWSSTRTWASRQAAPRAGRDSQGWSRRSASTTWGSSWAWRCPVLRAPRRTGISCWRSARFSGP